MLHLLFIACTQGEQTFGAVNETIGQDQGLAKLEYSPEYIIFSDVTLNILSSQKLTVRSVGDGALMIDKVDISNAANESFYMDESSTEDLSLLPDVTRDFDVTVTLKTNDAQYGELRIRSNDEDNRDVRVPLCAFPAGFEGNQACGNETDTGDTGNR